ncbi:MAG: hypothetical protein HYX74_06555, partial [Acidobacteria bacterium]|nr:hypothetical protein [Acidobacteriota bacterium]
VQMPGGAGAASSGNPEFIAPLARAAVAVGVSGIFTEVHDHPEDALSDGANALRIDLFEPLARELLELDARRLRAAVPADAEPARKLWQDLR